MGPLALGILIGVALVAIPGGIAWSAHRRRTQEAAQATIVPPAQQSLRGDWRRDSGEWHRVSAALRDSQEKYRVLVENANDAICVAQDGVIKFFNPKMLEMVGYSADQLPTVPFMDIVAPEDRALVLDRYQRRLRGENIPHQYKFGIQTAQGESLYVEINSVMIDWEGRPAHALLFP